MKSKYTNEEKQSNILLGNYKSFLDMFHDEALWADYDFRDNWLNILKIPWIDCCQSIYRSQWRRRKKMLTKAEEIINIARLGFNGLEAHFLTLTFTDDIFAITSEKTRRRYVSRYLKQYYAIYIANKDLGSKNNREHYHALCLTNGNDVDFKDWHKYGAIKMEHVRIDENSSPIKITKYINKLSFHALKESASTERAIYSRL